jgi:hypothetical protein
MGNGHKENPFQLKFDDPAKKITRTMVSIVGASGRTPLAPAMLFTKPSKFDYGLKTKSNIR